MKKTNRRSTLKFRDPKTAVQPQSRRKLVVFTGLVGALTLTSALLLAIAPAPLTPGATRSLFAVGSNDSIDSIFDTSVPIQADHWKYIYIHHSQNLGGDAQSIAQTEGGLADHFVIGNGESCVDGELQTGKRWTDQQPAGLTPGLDSMKPTCISICLAGDFNSASPTLTQQERLSQLVKALQRHLGIKSNQVFVLQPGTGPAGIGNRFSVDTLRANLLP